MRRNRSMTAVAVAAGALLATAVGVGSMALLGDAFSNGIAAQTTEGEIIEPITVQSGRFVQSTEPVGGTAQIVEADNNRYLVFDSDFNVAPREEGLNVLLVPESVPLDNYADVPLERYTNLGQLTAFEGEQRFLIPAEVDPNVFQSAIVVSPLTADTLGYAPFADNVNAEVVEPIGGQVQAQGDAVINSLEGVVIEPIGGQVQAQGDVGTEPLIDEAAAPVQTAQGGGVMASPDAAQAVEATPAPAVPDRAPRAYW